MSSIVQTEPVKDLAIVQRHRLNAEEFQKITEVLGRTPNLVELGVISVMWSEHCSYKSTLVHLKKLPTKAEWVICGPGENAGIIDIGDNLAAIFKMESHNHPSFIEPYQGAATGVGGIMRDVFTMGARPVANLNALRFGAADHPKTQYLLSNVVAGIGGYGNAVGVPTVGMECTFHPSYNGNILVNAMCVGVVPQNRIFYSKASNPGSLVMYVGAKTGRDGINGASMASAEFDENSASQKSTIQVGDPFREKLLIEACLELMQEDAIISVQDMGAAGLTSSSVEMATKGNLGIDLDLDKVPVREKNMTPYEIMLSESQERMLMVIRPDKQKVAEKIFEKWELDCSVIGKIATHGKIVITMDGGKVYADIPLSLFDEHMPKLERPYKIKQQEEDKSAEVAEKIKLMNPADILLKIVSSPDLCSKRWMYEQYDSKVMTNTIKDSSDGVAMIRVGDNNKSLVISTYSNPRYCKNDPVKGGMQAVVATYRNIVAMGAKPLAITNCLNFANPEKPEIMGQLVGCLEGMSEACKAFDYPIISGNASLYNETSGQSILPTPNIGGVGLVKNLEYVVASKFSSAKGELIFILGDNSKHLSCSFVQKELLQDETGAPPNVDIPQEKLHAEFIMDAIKDKLITGCKPVGDGGMIYTVAKMALESNISAKLSVAEDNLHARLFAEDQGRYIITCSDAESKELLRKALEKKLSLTLLGSTHMGDFVINDKYKIDFSKLKESYEATLPALMA